MKYKKLQALMACLRQTKGYPMTNNAEANASKNIIKITVKNIQALRGIAVLLVMLLHLYAIEKKYSADTILPELFHLGAFGVDIFFLISGFIMATVTAGSEKGIHTASNFLLLRLTRIYPLYWAITALLAILVLLIPGILSTPIFNTQFLINSFFLLPQPYIPLLSVGWTLVHEMYFYFIFSFFLLALKESHRLAAILIWCLISAIGYLYILPTQEQSPWIYIAINPLTLEFTTGCLIAMLLQKWQPKHPVFIITSGGFLAWLIWHFWQTQINNSEFPIGGDRVIYFLLPASLIVTGGVSMEKAGRILPAFLQKIGDASYSVYLTHVLVLSAMGKLWQPLGNRNSLLDNFAVLPIFCFVTIYAGMLCHTLLERKLLTLTRKKIPFSEKR
jgi:peptidoglycan/LPS O-acetylase OafA/YrhL